MIARLRKLFRAGWLLVLAFGVAACAAGEEMTSAFNDTFNAGFATEQEVLQATQAASPNTQVYVVRLFNRQTNQFEFRTVQVPAGSIRPPHALTVPEYQQMMAQRSAGANSAISSPQQSTIATPTVQQSVAFSGRPTVQPTTPVAGSSLGRVVSSQVVGRTTQVLTATTPVRATPVSTAPAAASGGDQRFGITNLKYNNFLAPGVSFDMGPASVRDSGNLSCVLTFDDGPHRQLDPQVLDILKNKGVRATFFYLGRLAASNPDIVRRAIAEGHEVGQHSFDHQDMSKLSASAIKSQFERTTAALSQAGVRANLFRPPYGAYNDQVLSAARSAGMTTLNWTNDSEDWKLRNPVLITNKVVEGANPGDVILLHSIQRATVVALPRIIDRLRAKGCNFTTAGNWLRQVSN